MVVCLLGSPIRAGSADPPPLDPAATPPPASAATVSFGRPFLIRYSSRTGFTLIPEGQGEPTNVDVNSVSLRVYDSSNNWIRIEAGPGPSGTHTPRDADQVFSSIFDSVNNAIHVNCLSGCASTTVFGTDITPIDATHQKVIGFNSIPISSASPTNGQVYQFSQSQNQWIPANVATFSPAGDLSGSPANQTVIGLQGRTLASILPGANQFLGWSSNQWMPLQPSFSNLAGSVADSQLGTSYSGAGSCPAGQFANKLTRGAGPTCSAAVTASTAPSNQFATGINASGALVYTQPAFSNLAGSVTDSQLGNPYSGVGSCPANLFVSTLTRNGAPTCLPAVAASSAPANQFATSIGASGALAYAQPSFSNLAGAISITQTPLASNGDLLAVSGGVLARLPIGSPNQCLQVLPGPALGYGSCSTGSGTVTTVSGASNQIVVTNPNTTPTLAIATPFSFPGKATTAAATAGGAGFNMPSGTAPASPMSGDFWQKSGVPEIYNGTATLAGVVNPEPATYNPSSTFGVECRVDGVIFASYTQCFTAAPDGATLRILDYMGAADPLSDPAAVNKGHQHWHILYLGPGQSSPGAPLPIPVNNTVHTGMSSDSSGAGNSVSCIDPDVGPAGANPWCVFQASANFPPAVNPPSGSVSASAAGGGTLTAQTDNIWLAYLTGSGPTEILVRPPGWTPSHKYGVGYPIMDTSTNCGGGPCTWVALTAGFSGSSCPAFNSNGTLGAKVTGDGGNPALSWMNIGVGTSFYQTPASVTLDGATTRQINVTIPPVATPITNTMVYLTQTASLSGASESGNTATLTSSANLGPNVVTGANVYVQGISGTGCAGYNGVWTITAASASSFSFWTPAAGLPGSCTMTAATYETVGNEAPSGITPTASTYQGVKAQSASSSTYSIGCASGCSQAAILSNGNSPVEVNASQSVFVLGPPNPGKQAGGIEIGGRVSNLTVDGAGATVPWNIFTGTVSVTQNSSTVTWKAGNKFQSGNLWTLAGNNTIAIGGVSYTVASVTDDGTNTGHGVSLTLTSPYTGSTSSSIGYVLQTGTYLLGTVGITVMGNPQEESGIFDVSTKNISLAAIAVDGEDGFQVSSTIKTVTPGNSDCATRPCSASGTAITTMIQPSLAKIYYGRPNFTHGLSDADMPLDNGDASPIFSVLTVLGPDSNQPAPDCTVSVWNWHTEAATNPIHFNVVQNDGCSLALGGVGTPLISGTSAQTQYGIVELSGPLTTNNVTPTIAAFYEKAVLDLATPSTATAVNYAVGQTLTSFQEDGAGHYCSVDAGVGCSLPSLAVGSSQAGSGPGLSLAAGDDSSPAGSAGSLTARGGNCNASSASSCAPGAATFGAGTNGQANATQAMTEITIPVWNATANPIAAGALVKFAAANNQVTPTVTGTDTNTFIGFAAAAIASGAAGNVVISGEILAPKTENTCAIGNFVQISQVSGGASGNVQCNATFSAGTVVGIAASAAAGTKASPAAIVVLVQPR